MLYYFIINSRADIKANMGPDFEDRIAGMGEEHKVYHTLGVGDATRFVRIYCDLHPADHVCFVACGGSGTLAEVAGGVVGFRNKCIAFLAYGSANDFCKHYPGRDFKSIDALLKGSENKVDIIRANNFYALNVANAGFDAMVTYIASRNIENGIDLKTAYDRAVMRSVLFNRTNRISVTADGERLNKTHILLCAMANASWYGGQYNCAPLAQVDDGLIEVVLLKPCSIVSFLNMMNHFLTGSHLQDPRCMKNIVYRRAKHIELDSKDLIYLALDGEVIPSTHFDIDILPNEITMILP